MQPYRFVVLHDHLDGGLRPTTILEQSTIPLPASDAAGLAAWFNQGSSGSLERYLESFVYTLGAMRSETAIARVAAEAVEDHSVAGVVHAEVRFGPLLLDPLPPEAVIEAVLEGFAQAEHHTGTTARLILCALRHLPGSDLVAGLAVRYRDAGVVGFDLAGPEAGFPPEEHLSAIETAREGGIGITLHAGEAAGVESIRTAVEICGTERIGHGIEVIDDCRVAGGEIVDLGPVAQAVMDHRIPLEVCPSSNLATKRWSIEQHPIAMLHRAGFVITLNTDNRLMSATSMAGEAELIGEGLGMSREEIDQMTNNAVRAAFLSESERLVVAEALAK